MSRATTLLALLFTLIAGVLLYAALPATDNFNRANGTLGANWTANQGSFTIESNRARPNQFQTDSLVRWNADMPNADHYVQGTYGVNAWYGVAVRVGESGMVAYVWSGDSSSQEITLYNGSGATPLNSNATGLTNGLVMKLEIVGSVLKAYRNGVLDAGLVGTGLVDSSLPSGRGGMQGWHNVSGPGVGLDDFQVGNASGAAPRKKNATVSFVLIPRFPTVY